MNAKTRSNAVKAGIFAAIAGVTIPAIVVTWQRGEEQQGMSASSPGGRASEAGRDQETEEAPAARKVRVRTPDDEKNPNFRVIKGTDGSREEFAKSDDGKELSRESWDATGHLMLTRVYRLSQAGKPLNCSIFDALGVQIFKARFGYRKPSPGNDPLVVEEMFDTTSKRLDPNTGEELPVKRYIHTYNTDGSPKAPMMIEMVPSVAPDPASESAALVLNPFS